MRMGNFFIRKSKSIVLCKIADIDIKIDSFPKSTEKIDGAIATIMGLDRAIRCGNAVTASVYDDALKNYHWDSEILGLVAQIHEYKGRQELYLKQKPAALDKLIEIAKIQSTEASNKIEGIVTTSTRVQQLCMEKTTSRNRDEEEIHKHVGIVRNNRWNYSGKREFYSEN